MRLKSYAEVTSFALRKRRFRAFINRKNERGILRVSRRNYTPDSPVPPAIEFCWNLPLVAKDIAKMHSHVDPRINLLSDDMLKVPRVYVS